MENKREPKFFKGQVVLFLNHTLNEPNIVAGSITKIHTDKYIKETGYLYDIEWWNVYPSKASTCVDEIFIYGNGQDFCEAIKKSKTLASYVYEDLKMSRFNLRYPSEK